MDKINELNNAINNIKPKGKYYKEYKRSLHKLSKIVDKSRDISLKIDVKKLMPKSLKNKLKNIEFESFEPNDDLARYFLYSANLFFVDFHVYVGYEILLYGGDAETIVKVYKNDLLMTHKDIKLLLRPLDISYNDFMNVIYSLKDIFENYC